MEKTPEQIAWERASRAGNARARKALLRVVAALVSAAAAGVLTLLLLLQWEELKGQTREQLLAEGHVVLQRRKETGLHLFVLPGAVGLGAFLGVFHLLGGRLSPEYLRGLGRD
jgi:hypothetical protein